MIKKGRKAMMKNTDLFPVTKTLEFELKPVGKTKKLTDDYHNGEGIVALDKKRSDSLPVIKGILDDYYREIISKWLSVSEIKRSDVVTAFEHFKKLICKEIDGKTYTKEILAPLAEKLIAQLKDLNFEYKSYPVLFNEGELDDFIINNESYKSKKDEYLETKNMFNDYTAYLKKFKEARERIFSSELKHGTIVNRIFSENMATYFYNYLLFERIRENYGDLYDEIEHYEEYFLPDLYDCFTQEKIESYNNLISHETENRTNEKCLNSIISEYRQKNKIIMRDLPLFVTLKKQILSIVEKQKKFAQLERDYDFISMTVNTYVSSITILEQLRTLMSNFSEENMSDYKIPKSMLSIMSNSVYDSWDLITKALEFGENYEKSEYSILEIVSSIDKYLLQDEEGTHQYCKGKDIYIYYKYVCNDLIKSINAKWMVARRKLDNFNKKDIKDIKDFYDEVLNIKRVFKVFNTYDCNSFFSIEMSNILETFDTECNKSYNMARNYIMKKPYSLKKFPLTFGSSYFGQGWDIDSISSRLCLFLMKDNKYYIAILNKFTNNKDVKKLFQTPHKAKTDDFYKIVEYKQLTSSYRTLPRVYFSAKSKEIVEQSLRLKEIKSKKLYNVEANDRQALTEWIDAMKKLLEVHPVYRKFSFTFRESCDYANVNEFYQDVDNQGMLLNFSTIDADTIKKYIDNEDLYLFQLYNKDFSECNLRNPNHKNSIFTNHLISLFSDNNIKNIRDGKPFTKLNGGFNVYYRDASLSIEDTVIHKANEPIKNKNPKNKNPYSRKYRYDIVKDRRFLEDKFICQLNVTLNFSSVSEYSKIGSYNSAINKEIKEEGKNILCITRDYSRLFYYKVVSSDGRELEKGHIDTISNFDYSELIKNELKEMVYKQQNWNSYRNIDAIKEGYISVALSVIVKLQEKYNAIIIIEDTRNDSSNISKTGLSNIIYNGFAMKLLNKLRYVQSDGEPPRQLVAPVSTLNDIYIQNGIVFFINNAYTNFVTGTNYLYSFGKSLIYKNKNSTLNFLNSLKKFGYDCNTNKVVIQFTYADVGSKIPDNTLWTIAIEGEWTFYDKENKKTTIDVLSRLQEVFNKEGICITDELYDFSSASVSSLKEILNILRLCCSMKNIINGTNYITNSLIKINNEKTLPFNIEFVENKANNMIKKMHYLINHITTDNKISLNYNNYLPDYMDWCKSTNL